MKEEEKALIHADKAIEFDPLWFKGYIRKIDSFLVNKNDENIQKASEEMQRIFDKRIILPTKIMKMKLKEIQFFESKVFKGSKKYSKFIIVNSDGSNDCSTLQEALLLKLDQVSIILLDEINKIKFCAPKIDLNFEVIGIQSNTIIKNTNENNEKDCILHLLNSSVLFKNITFLNQTLYSRKGGKLKLQNCIFKDTKDWTNISSEGVDVCFNECKFQDCHNALICSEGKIKVKNSTFLRTKKMPFELRTIKSTGNYLIVKNWQFIDCFGGIVVSYNKENRIIIKNTTFSGIRGVTNQRTTSTCISVHGGGFFRLKNCAFHNCLGNGSMINVLVMMNKTKFEILENEFLGNGTITAVSAFTRNRGVFLKNKFDSFMLGCNFHQNNMKRILFDGNIFQKMFAGDVQIDSNEQPVEINQKKMKILNLGKQFSQHIQQMKQTIKVRKEFGTVYCSNCMVKERDDEEKFKKCARCKVNYYCSRKCQKAHWPVHKHQCKEKK